MDAGDQWSVIRPEEIGLLSCLPGTDPFADALVRDAFAAIKRGERFAYPAHLPLVDVEVGDDRFGREERAGTASALGGLFKFAFGRAPYAN